MSDLTLELIQDQPKAEKTRFTPGELNQRSLYRRAVEAVVWGMPAVNYDRML